MGHHIKYPYFRSKISEVKKQRRNSFAKDVSIGGYCYEKFKEITLYPYHFDFSYSDNCVLYIGYCAQPEQP